MTGVVTRTHRNLRDALRRSSIASFQTLVHHFKDLTHLENENLNSESVSIDEKGLQSDKEPTPPTSEIQESASWKFLQGSETGLHDSLIPESAWKVLRLLHRKGFEAYLVGGSVRDLLLKRTPKDFDILTTAEPSEVKKHFARIMRCMIIGRRFPICHVYSLGTVVEVSSFSTNGSLKNQRRCDSTGVTPDSNISNSAKLCTDRDFARWKNCMKRDFTVNGLLYDPFGHVLYDYIGGLKDLKERKLRTIVSADDSFEEDSARMLRAIRIAARLGFQFSRDTASSIHTYALLLSSINKARLMAEVDIMMAYGSAEPSLRLLWRFGVLDLLLPLQASYFTSQRFRRRGRGVNLLLILLRNLDRVVAPSRACHSSLWVALLAFHLALEKKKRSHIVAAAGALAVCYQDMQEALAKTRRVESRLKQGEFAVDDTYFLDVKDLSEDDIQEQASELLDDAVESLRNMLDEDFLEKATEYNEGQYKSKMLRSKSGVLDGGWFLGLSCMPPCNTWDGGLCSSNCRDHVMWKPFANRQSCGYVVIPKPVSSKVIGLFLGAKTLVKSHWGEKDGKSQREKDERSRNEALTRGDRIEVGFIFSRIILNTLYPSAKKVSSVLS